MAKFINRPMSTAPYITFARTLPDVLAAGPATLETEIGQDGEDVVLGAWVKVTMNDDAPTPWAHWGRDCRGTDGVVTHLFVSGAEARSAQHHVAIHPLAGGMSLDQAGEILDDPDAYASHAVADAYARVEISEAGGGR